MGSKPSDGIRDCAGDPSAWPAASAADVRRELDRIQNELDALKNIQVDPERILKKSC